MAFDFTGPHSRASIDDHGECIFDLPQRYGVSASFLARIGGGDYYRSTTIQGSALPAFLREVEQLLELRREEIEPTVRKRKRLHSRALAAQPELLERFLREDAAYRTLGDICRVAMESFEAGVALRCAGD